MDAPRSAPRSIWPPLPLAGSTPACTPSTTDSSPACASCWCSALLSANSSPCGIPPRATLGAQTQLLRAQRSRGQVWTRGWQSSKDRQVYRPIALSRQPVTFRPTAMDCRWPIPFLADDPRAPKLWEMVKESTMIPVWNERRRREHPHVAAFHALQ